MKFASGLVGVAGVAAALMGSASAASYDDIPDIEAYGQHFFYTNNGSQLYVRAHTVQATANITSATLRVLHTSKTTRLMALSAPTPPTLTHWLMAMLAGGIFHT